MPVRLVYLHGFASSPRSTKAVALARWAASRGLGLECPDLNLPSFERLSLPAQLHAVRAMLANDPRPTVLIGSSMGGYLAALLAPRRGDERAGPPGVACVAGLVLLAPAFDLFRRWRERLGDEGWARWQRQGAMPYHHYALGREAPLHSGFLEEAASLPPWPGTSVPACVVQGRRDTSVPHTTAREWVDQNRQARLVEVDDDHQLLASRPIIEHEVEGLLGAVDGARR